MKPENEKKFMSTALMALFMVGVLLWARQMLAGWLLPDGQFLEALAHNVQNREGPLTEAVFSAIEEWFLYE